MPSKLAVLETTIDNNNASLWDAVTPQTVPYWIRNQVANRLATGGVSWHEIFSRYNSGTYNNEWLVVDYSLFTPGASSSLPENLLVVGDQMPGLYNFTDVTATYLAPGTQEYWASYNRPAYPLFPAIFNASNQWPLIEKYGDHFTWDKTARAQIFAREQASIVDADSYAAVIRYNHFQTDPLGTQSCKDGTRSGSNAISERGDLTPTSAKCISDVARQDEGGIDAKFTSAAFMLAQQRSVTVRAQSGPTHDSQPPFNWSGCAPQCFPHAGLPSLWDFEWQEFVWGV